LGHHAARTTRTKFCSGDNALSRKVGWS